MSAYLVSENHIRVLTEALYKYEVPCNETLTPDEVGANLWAENAASVAYRYQEPAEELAYSHVMTDWLRGLVNDPWAVLSLCRGYSYQACEHPEWEESFACKQVEALEALALQATGCTTLEAARRNPAWDKAPWSIGDEPPAEGPAPVTAPPTGPRRHISTTETAKLIRAALKHAFPGVKFSVRSKKYSGGSSINVDWIDGPTAQEAEKVYKRFEGASFDGINDLKSYHDTELNGELVHFGADYIFGNRNLSKAFLAPIAAKIAVRYGVPAPEIQVSEYSGAYVDNDYGLTFDTRETGMEPLGTIIYRAAIQVSAMSKPRVRITAIARPCTSVA